MACARLHLHPCTRAPTQQRKRTTHRRPAPHARAPRLAPGEQWHGEFVIRHHERYWDPPVFDRDAPQPMPKLVPQRDDADDREEVDEERLVEGVTGSSLGGGPSVPHLWE
jgi:hypothetical protein